MEVSMDFILHIMLWLLVIVPLAWALMGIIRIFIEEFNQ